MRPRLTPSTGISTLRASSAARRNVPSPPRTSTSSQPSAARSSASTTSISTPSARMSSGARCSGPRSTASADSTRSPMPLSPSTFSTRRAVSVASSRPVCTTSRMCAFARSLRPLRDGLAYRLLQRVALQRMVGLRPQAQEVLDVARRTRQRAGGDIDGAASRVRRRGGRRPAPRPPRNCGIGRPRRPRPRGPCPTSNCGFTMGTISASADAQDVSAGSTVASEMNDRSATTRSTGPPIAVGGQFADVGALQHDHPRVGCAVTTPAGRSRRRPRRPRAAPRSSRTSVKPPVEAPASRQRRPSTRQAERIERADQLVRAAGHPGAFVGVRSTVSVALTATAVAGLAAGMPSMLTRPAPINSAACWRERARPRRTSSASTRARRVTCALALLDRFQRADQQVVRLLQAAPRWRRCPSRRAVESASSAAGSGSIGEQRRDLGADLVGVGTSCRCSR